MTREEAMEALSVLKIYDAPWLREALDMAIEALSEKNIARDIATILEHEQDMRVMLQNAERPKGEWIDVENEPYCECSVCGSYIDNLDDDYAFCPRCGAKMKGGAE
jgi:rubrerythrin